MEQLAPIALGSIKMDIKLNPDGDNSSLPTSSKKPHRGLGVREANPAER
jgi:hypothetical protein